MNQLQPLTALLAQTERQRDLALADQMKARAAADAAQRQAEQLLDYRRDYEQRWNAQFTQSGSIELMRCYQGFTERLTQAVEQQLRAARQANAALARAADAVREREVQVAAVRTLMERRMAEARTAARRHEQRETDELAARVAWSGRAGRDGANPG
jgi:flagellar FliJ protein